MRGVIFFLLCGLLAGVFGSVEVAQAKESRQAIVVLVNRAGTEEVAQLPAWQRLAQGGAAGWMNGNTGGPRRKEAAYATLAMGVPGQLKAPLDVQNAWERAADGSAAERYERWMGVPAQGEVLVLSMAELNRSQSQREFAGQLGGAGDALRAAGLSAAVFGNEDRAPVQWRPAALLTADRLGRTAYGDVSNQMLIAATERPYGVRTDYEAMWSGYQRVKGNASLVVFDLGDLGRLAAYRESLTEERYGALKRQVLAETDQFIARVQAEAGPNRLVVFVSPQVSKEARARGELLAPLAVAGGDWQAGTVLTSPTTRRAGIVTNLDVMPTVLHFLGAQIPREMIGYPLRQTEEIAQGRLPDLLRATVWNYTNRAAVLTGVGVLAALALWGAVSQSWPSVAVRLPVVKGLLWAALSMPLCLYLLPLLRPESLWDVAGGVLTVWLLVIAAPFRWLCKSVPVRLFWLAGWTLGAVVADVWAGGTLAKASLLSYDPIVGARYYGVGNEYMGVLVAAGVLLYASALQIGVNRRRAEIAFLLGSLLLTLFFASPELGTNTGGALTAAGTAALAYALQRGWSWRQAVCKMLWGLGVALASLWALNVVGDGHAPSHIAAATHQVINGGGIEVLRILARKTDMVRRLFTATIWPTVLLFLIAGFAWRLFLPSARETRWNGPYAPFVRSFAALLGGAGIGLVTNDSGIVVAALMFLYTAFPGLLLWLDSGAHRSVGAWRQSA